MRTSKDARAHVTRTINSPLGRITLAATVDGLTHVQFGNSTKLPRNGAAGDENALCHLDTAERALDEYFAGRRTCFDDLVLAPAGTAFQQRVWKALRSIPHGKTATYGGIARKLHRPGAARAVGLANNRNPLAIVVPCHRVVGASGALTGYAAGLDAKAWLLRHEGVDL